MHYFDPARPRLPNGLPTWRAAPNISLPRLIIVPLEVGELSYRIEAMINSSWKSFNIYGTTSLDALLSGWKLDPEQFAKDYFGVESIRAEGAPQLTESLPSVNPADLGI